MGFVVCLSLLVLVLAATAAASKYEILDYDPVANPNSIVIASDKQARFTVLTSRLIRMEWTDSSHVFEDRASLAFVNRNLPVAEFSAAESLGILTIVTKDLTLTYKVGHEFSEQSLVVKGNNADSGFVEWNGSMSSKFDTGNLLGTFRTLDGTDNVPLNCSLNQKDHCVEGLISRSGWSLVDDSDTPILDEEDWWADENGKMYVRDSTVDWYLFAHGRDFKGALFDFSLVGGKIPVFPRFASGIWFTRWYDYNNVDTRHEVLEHLSRAIPLDVWIYDMNFHKKDDWSGYTFDPNLFPFPEDTLAFLHSKFPI